MPSSERYSVTTWPSGRITPLPLEAHPGVRVIAGHGLAIPRQGEQVALPEELYSRQLLDLDLGSEGAIADFISRYGLLLDEDWLGLPAPVPEAEWMKGLNLVGRPLRNVKREMIATLRGMEEDGHGPEVVAAVAFAMNTAMATERLRRRTTMTLQRTHTIVHCDQVRIAAWQLRDMTRLFVEAAEGSDGSRALAAWESRHWARPVSLEEALLDSACILNKALSRFCTRVEVYGSHETVALYPETDAYRAMCLQLFNDIAETTPWRTCQSDTCGRPFRRQIGRALYGQYRLEGEKLHYCSPSCAAAQRSRVRRTRIATAARYAREGLTPQQTAERMSTSEDVVTAEQVRGWLAAGAKRRKGGAS